MKMHLQYELVYAQYKLSGKLFSFQIFIFYFSDLFFLSFS